MYLYVGEEKYKKLSDVIGIFDMDSATVCVATRSFLQKKEKRGEVESDGELPKSFLLLDKREKEKKRRTSQRGKTIVFLSKLAAGVLFTRTAIKIDKEENKEE